MFELYDLQNKFSYYCNFYISAKEKNYSEAGRKNNISPSSLTRSVTQLEEQLNLKLVNTSNRGFELTLDGERLFKQLEKFFDNIAVFTSEELSESLDVTLTIGTTRNIADFALNKYLTKFKRKYPEAKYHIQISNAETLKDYLLNRKIDVLFDYLPNSSYSEKSDLNIVPIFQLKTCFACSKQFYEENKDNIKSLKDLSNYKLVISGSSRRRTMLDEMLLKNNVTLKIDTLMPDSKLMADYIKDNDCIGYFIEDELETYNLVKLELQEEMPVNPVGLIYPKNINHTTNKFVDMILHSLAK